MDEAGFQEFVARNHWVFARTYAATHPHEYVVQEHCADGEEFEAACRFVREHGTPERFYRLVQPYLHRGGYRYWVMFPVLNRARLDLRGYREQARPVLGEHVDMDRQVETWLRLEQEAREGPRK